MTILEPNRINAKSVDKSLYKRKTDMCKNGDKCPYLNSGCFFAHSKEELRVISLDEREKAGLIPNAVHFRTLPCFSFTCTGGCRYNKKCTFLHDPRLACTTMEQGRCETASRKHNFYVPIGPTKDSIICWPAMDRKKVSKNLDMYKLPTADQPYIPEAVCNGRFTQSWEIFTRVCSGDDAKQVKTIRLPVFKQMTDEV